MTCTTTRISYGDESVVDEDALSNLDDLWQVLVVQVEHLAGALLQEGLVRGQLDRGSLLQRQLLSSIILKNDK